MRWLFPDRCRVYGYVNHDQIGQGVTESVRVVLHEELPCRVSFRRYPVGKEADGGVALVQGLLLFSPREITLPPGCEVEFGGRTYRRMGESAVYPSHRESAFVLEAMA